MKTKKYRWKKWAAIVLAGALMMPGIHSYAAGEESGKAAVEEEQKEETKKKKKKENKAEEKNEAQKEEKAEEKGESQKKEKAERNRDFGVSIHGSSSKKTTRRFFRSDAR